MGTERKKRVAVYTVIAIAMLALGVWYFAKTTTPPTDPAHRTARTVSETPSAIDKKEGTASPSVPAVYKEPESKPESKSESKSTPPLKATEPSKEPEIKKDTASAPPQKSTNVMQAVKQKKILDKDEICLLLKNFLASRSTGFGRRPLVEASLYDTGFQEKLADIMYNNDNPDMRFAALDILSKLRFYDEKFQEMLIPVIRSEKNNKVLNKALCAIAALPKTNPKLVEAMLDLLKCKDPTLCVINSLGAQKSPAAIEPIARIVEDPTNPLNRNEGSISYALSAIGGPRSIIILSSMLERENNKDNLNLIIEGLRDVARNNPNKLDALGTKTIGKLLDLLGNDQYKVLRTKITGVLSYASNEKIYLGYEATDDEVNKVIEKFKAQNGLGTSGDYVLQEEMTKMRAELNMQLLDADSGTRKAAVRALRKRGQDLIDKSTINNLLEVYQKCGNESMDEKQELIQTLGYAGQTNTYATEQLVAIYKRTNDDLTKANIITALGSEKNDIAEQHLVGIVSDNKLNNLVVKTAAIQALVRVDSKKAIAPLLGILASNEPRLYQFASLAIRDISGDKTFPILTTKTDPKNAEKIAREWENKFNIMKNKDR